MKNIRVVPVIITAAVSVAVLFGGWTLYNQVAVAAPIEEAIAAADGIDQASKPELTGDSVTVKVTLSENANLREIYESIAVNGKDAIGGRELMLDIQNGSNKELDGYWYQALFEVAEAMENKSYSDIPAALETITQQNKGVTATTEIDETNVYITLKKGDAVKFIILPRTPAQLGVWTNA